MNKISSIQLKFAAHDAPEFKVNPNSKWVLYGTDQQWRNRYPDYLLHLFDTSAKHNAIVRGKADYINGNGWRVNGDTTSTVMAAQLQRFVNDIAEGGLSDLSAAVALDIELFGGAAIEVIYNVTNKKIARLSHMEFAKVRTDKDGKLFFYSPDGWKKSQPEKVEIYPAFNATEPVAKSILYVKLDHPAYGCYPLPTYMGAIPYIELDGEIANFHLNGIKNGFMAGTMISFFNGVPDSEEAQRIIEDKVNDKFAGSSNSNRILLTFSDRPEDKPAIDQLNGNDLDKRFDVLNRTVQQEIFTGHRIVDPALFGVKPEGIFATRNQIRDSYELFQKTYINARQRFLEYIFNGFASVNGLPKALQIVPTEPIGQEFSEMTLVSVMTQDEIREKAGLPKLDNGEVVAGGQFSAQDSDLRLVARFAECGIPYTPEQVGGQQFFTPYTSLEDMDARESELLTYGFTDTAFDMAVLQALKDNPSMGMAEIAAMLKATIEAVQMAVNRNIQSGYLALNITDVIGSEQRLAKVSESGLRALSEVKPLKASFSIAYRYVLAGGVPGPEVMDTTRDFCREMVRLSKSRVWTQADITRISLSEDRNVWQRRGGFWTRKGSNVTTHYCRHAWERVLIQR